MKLARKLAFFMVLGVCIVLALDAWVEIRRDVTLYTDDTHRDEHITGRALGFAVERLWRSEGREQALDFIARTNEDPAQPFVRWVELDARPGDPRAPRLPRTALTAVAQGRELYQVAQDIDRPGRFFTYIPVRIGGKVAGALELSESLGESRRHTRVAIIHRVVSTAVLILLLGVLAVVLGALFVGRPVHRLVEKARRVGSGDLSMPVGLRQRDELGELGREIDAMCESLAAARERIESETAARNKATEQLRHADRLATVGKLAAGVAHELGTPLSVVSQRARMIATEEVRGTDALSGARIIVEQSQRMTGVIRQLLGFARHHVPQKTPCDLRKLAGQTIAFLEPFAARRGVTMRFEGDELPAYAQVDGSQIQQALANLTVNGIQAMDEGGELRVTIEHLTARPPADHDGTPGFYLRLSVRDRGHGIPPEDLPHLFEPFFTTKEVGEGTGLGLAVAYGIVRENGGWIDVESEPGRGSTFSILLPWEAGAANGHAPAPAPRVVEALG